MPDDCCHKPKYGTSHNDCKNRQACVDAVFIGGKSYATRHANFSGNFPHIHRRRSYMKYEDEHAWIMVIAVSACARGKPCSQRRWITSKQLNWIKKNPTSSASCKQDVQRCIPTDKPAWWRNNKLPWATRNHPYHTIATKIMAFINGNWGWMREATTKYVALANQSNGIRIVRICKIDTGSDRGSWTSDAIGKIGDGGACVSKKKNALHMDQHRSLGVSMSVGARRKHTQSLKYSEIVQRSQAALCVPSSVAGSVLVLY